MKNIIPGDFQHQVNIQKQLSQCPNIRTVVDSVRETEAFFYPFLDGDLLRFSQRNLSGETRKSILRSALQGLVEMHAKDMVHNGKQNMYNLSMKVEVANY